MEGYVPSVYLELANEDETSHDLHHISTKVSPKQQLSQERSPEPQERSPGPQERSPELQELSPDSQEQSPELQMRSHEPQERSPEPQERSPEPQERSPEPQEQSLDPQEQSPEPQERSPELTDGLVELEDETDDGSHDEEECGLTYCQVLYSFDAGSDVELSVEEGEWVWLLKSHDRTGNSEWWLVQKEGGAKGFVPANYLQSS